MAGGGRAAGAESAAEGVQTTALRRMAPRKARTLARQSPWLRGGVQAQTTKNRRKSRKRNPQRRKNGTRFKLVARSADNISTTLAAPGWFQQRFLDWVVALNES